LLDLSVNDDGAVMRNMGRRSQALVALVFEDIGGREAFADWAVKNPGDFYTKMFVKLMPRHIEVEEKKSVEDYLEEIDGGAAQILDDDPASNAPPSGAGASPFSGPAPLPARAPPPEPEEPKEPEQPNEPLPREFEGDDWADEDWYE